MIPTPARPPRTGGWGPTLAGPRGLLVAMHAPFVAFAAAQGAVGVGLEPSRVVWPAVPAVLAAGALQLRHSLAAADGVRPRHWRWSLLALLVITYAPLPILGDRWFTLHWFVVASCAMLLPPRWGLVAGAADAAAWPAWRLAARPEGWLLSAWFAELTVAQQAAYVLYMFAVLAVGGASLYAAARLVRVGDELRAARADLAELAVGRERLRVSRDLHDLLGQSLAAVALKGDLAVGLLERRQVVRAAAEVEDLVAVARSALHDVRGLARGEPPISFAAELERGADLLAVAGVDTRVAVAADGLPAPAAELFGWAVREGVTNVLRHSVATTCAIRVWREGGALCLEIANDGAAPAPAPAIYGIGGHGLESLAARAAALSGIARGGPTGADGFRLRVEVPDSSADASVVSPRGIR